MDAEPLNWSLMAVNTDDRALFDSLKAASAKGLTSRTLGMMLAVMAQQSRRGPTLKRVECERDHEGHKAAAQAKRVRKMAARLDTLDGRHVLLPVPVPEKAQ
jgi:hypothetical protein